MQINPTYSDYFAAGLENGMIQLWDLRKPTGGYIRRIVAHDRLVLSVRWHPQDPNRLASGGRDGAIHVWNLLKKGGSAGGSSGSTGESSLSPDFTIRTQVPGASVSRLSWRPGHPNSIASCAGVNDYAVHVWDGSRPYMPLATFDAHRNDVTSFFWAPQQWAGLPEPEVGPGGQPRQCLVSCSRDGTVRLNWMGVPHSSGGPIMPYRGISPVSTSWAMASATARPDAGSGSGPDRTARESVRDGHRRGAAGSQSWWLQEQQLCVAGRPIDRNCHLNIASVQPPEQQSRGSDGQSPVRRKAVSSLPLPHPLPPPPPPPPQIHQATGAEQTAGGKMAAGELGFDLVARNYVLKVPPPATAGPCSFLWPLE